MLKQIAYLLPLIALLCGCGSKSGESGETCTKASDCKDSLKCISGICGGTAQASSAPTETDAMLPDGSTINPETGAVIPPAQHIGQVNDSCYATADCAVGLVCRYYSGIGKCQASTTGLKPTGKTCDAECITPKDCEQIPIGTTDTLGTISINSCADLASILGTTAPTCDGTTPANTSKECFLYKTYCEASADTWLCTNGKCSYNKGCTVASFDAMKGCPQKSRSGRQLDNCDTATTKKCAPVIGAAYCTTDSSCDTKPIVDKLESCKTGECVCVENNCYRKCNDNDPLDCESGYTCSAKKVCEREPVCATDEVCIKKHGVKSKCVTGACVESCKTDLECNFDLNGTITQVCFEGVCQKVGCSDNSECVGTNNVKLFCTAPPAPTAVTTYRSAITN